MIISFDEVYPLWCATERNLGEFDTHSAVCKCSHHLPFYTCVVWYWYMKVVLGFVLIRSEYHSVSLGSFSCRFHSSYFQWLVPGECVYECCFVLFSQFEKFIGSINTFQFGAVLQLIFVILLPSLHYFEKWALQLYLHFQQYPFTFFSFLHYPVTICYGLSWLSYWCFCGCQGLFVSELSSSLSTTLLRLTSSGQSMDWAPQSLHYSGMAGKE